MKLASGYSTDPDTHKAIEIAYNQIYKKIGKPDFVILLSSEKYENVKVLHYLFKKIGHKKIFGATSCLGVFTEQGVHNESGRGLGLLGFSDKLARFGLGNAEEITLATCKISSQKAIKNALIDAESVGEVPSLILISAAPGCEEEVIEGIVEIVGRQVPIFGGSSADNFVAGKWNQFCGTDITTQGFVVAALFLSTPIGYAIQNGYVDTDLKGVITKAKDRVVYEIDHTPAALLYNKWTAGALNTVLEKDENILSLTTLFPIGKKVGEIRDNPYFRLSHPYAISLDNSLSFLTAMKEGETLYLMRGTKDALITRMERVVRLAVETLDNPDKVQGGFFIFCAGCMMTTKDRLPEIVQKIDNTFSNISYLGMFSFGEQGCYFTGENYHANLMIFAVVFSD